MNRDGLFIALSSRVLPAFRENLQVTIDNPEDRKSCMSVIYYKVLLALYEICQETENGMSWEDCADLLRKLKEFRDAAESVVLYTMEKFISTQGFDFDAKEINLMPKESPGKVDGVFHSVKLFSDEREEVLFDLFFLIAETEFYHRQRREGKIASWKEYLDELQEGGPAWDAVNTAVLNGIGKMDFRIGWLADGLDEFSFLEQPPEIEEKGESNGS